MPTSLGAFAPWPLRGNPKRRPATALQSRPAGIGPQVGGHGDEAFGTVELREAVPLECGDAITALASRGAGGTEKAKDRLKAGLQTALPRSEAQPRTRTTTRTRTIGPDTGLR